MGKSRLFGQEFHFFVLTLNSAIVLKIDKTKQILTAFRKLQISNTSQLELLSSHPHRWIPPIELVAECYEMIMMGRFPANQVIHLPTIAVYTQRPIINAIASHLDLGMQPPL